jgi:hypothetical protein
VGAGVGAGAVVMVNAAVQQQPPPQQQQHPAGAQPAAEADDGVDWTLHIT